MSKILRNSSFTPEMRRCGVQRTQLTQFVEDRMAGSGRCAQFDTILVRTAKSCDSLFINRCVCMFTYQFTHHTVTTHNTSSHTYRINSAVVDYRPASGNVEAICLILCLSVFMISLFCFAAHRAGCQVGDRKNATRHGPEPQDMTDIRFILHVFVMSRCN